MRAPRLPRTASERGPGRRWSLLLDGVVLLAVLVRSLHLVAMMPTHFFTYHRTFAASDMYLFDQWAQRIVGGDPLGREVFHPVIGWQLRAAPAERWEEWYGRSPVFFKAPLYPYLLASLRASFGDAMLPIAILQILASAASAVLLFRITARLFDPAAGLCAALFYALYAPAIHYDAIMLRGPWIALVALAATWQLIGLWTRPAAGRAGLLGVTAGLALLLNEGFHLLPPLLLAALAWRSGAIRRAAIVGGAFVLGLVLVLSPLVARNVLVGAPPLALAVTGSTVHAVFNTADSNPHFFAVNDATLGKVMEESGGELIPTVLACLRSFPGIGDLALFYLRKSIGLVIPFENPDNADFYYATLKDPLLGYLPTYALLLPLGLVGLVLALGRPGRLLPLLPAALPLWLTTMVGLPLSRYRVTLAVFLVPFAGVALAQGARWLRQRRLRPLALAGASGVLVFACAAALQRHVVFAGRTFSAYRPTEFKLAAEFLARQGRYREAAEELLDLARLAPHRRVRSMALLSAAGLQAREGDRASASDTLARAADADPQDANLLVAVGDAYRELLGDHARARLHYSRALELHPAPDVLAGVRSRLQVLPEDAPMH